MVNSLTADERRLAQQQAAGGSSRIYRELETGYSSGSSRAGSTGGPGAVARPATLDFTDIGEEAAYSDDNLCEEQPMVTKTKTGSDRIFISLFNPFVLSRVI